MLPPSEEDASDLYLLLESLNSLQGIWDDRIQFKQTPAIVNK